MSRSQKMTAAGTKNAQAVQAPIPARSVEQAYLEAYKEIHNQYPDGTVPLQDINQENELEDLHIKNSINVLHGAPTSHGITMTFNGSLGQFASDPQLSNWCSQAGGRNNMVIGSSYSLENNNGGKSLQEKKPFAPKGFVFDVQGNLYRTVLQKVTIKTVANSTPLEIGVKIKNIPTFNGEKGVITRNGDQFNYVLSPGNGNATPYNVEHVIYENHIWDDERLAQLGRDKLLHLTPQMIDESIFKRGEDHWLVHETSPLLQQAIRDSNPAMMNMIKPIPLPGTNKKVAFISADIAKSLKARLDNTMSVLPLHDPYDVVGSIERADGRGWTDPNVGGSNTSISHPILKDKGSLNDPEHVRVDVDLQYRYFQVNPSM